MSGFRIMSAREWQLEDIDQQIRSYRAELARQAEEARRAPRPKPPAEPPPAKQKALRMRTGGTHA